MKLATETITIFHDVTNPDTSYNAWTPTIIRGVSFHGDTATTVTDTGLLAASKFSIRIPVDADTGGRAYVEPHVMDNEDNPGNPETRFTLAIGDVLVKGEETGTDWNPNKLREKYGSIVTVVGVADNRNRPRGKHWKLTGK